MFSSFTEESPRAKDQSPMRPQQTENHSPTKGFFSGKRFLLRKEVSSPTGAWLSSDERFVLLRDRLHFTPITIKWYQSWVLMGNLVDCFWLIISRCMNLLGDSLCSTNNEIMKSKDFISRVC